MLDVLLSLARIRTLSVFSLGGVYGCVRQCSSIEYARWVWPGSAHGLYI